MIRLGVALGLAIAGCGCGGSPRTAEPPSESERFGPLFGWVDPGATALSVAVHTVPFGDRGTDHPMTYHYTVRSEPSGVTADLHAVVIDGWDAYAAGDDGIVLHRTDKTGWTREAVPTEHRLRALARDNASGLYAVGDAGTVLRRANGAWVVEPVPTTADLYDVALSLTSQILYAVGDHGTLLERRDGTWQAIASNTEADLRRFDGSIAVGRDGAIISCVRWGRDRMEPGHRLACVPQPSPTHADLRAMGGEYTAWRVYGAEGTVLRVQPHSPLDIALDAPIASGATISAAGDNSWYASVQIVTILVGTGGQIEFAGTPRTQLAIAGAPDLLGVASAATDAFVVGAGGTIVHLQSPDIVIPIAHEV
ncbi:MAG TPA: hypothetical protein VHW23_12615 [Kofleriaceae bacterium]|jgi:hypothetical protein|nr:hypothetical protein [Kofleriaceae bacterium]